jgi:methylmalonyl-CoA mutase, N-terminal domain
VVVGVNKFTGDDGEPYEPLRVDPMIEEAQAEQLRQLRRSREEAVVRKHVDALKTTAEGTGNVLPPIKDALRAGATLGEVCDTLREIWGVYRPPDVP